MLFVSAPDWVVFAPPVGVASLVLAAGARRRPARARVRVRVRLAWVGPSPQGNLLIASSEDALDESEALLAINAHNRTSRSVKVEAVGLIDADARDTETTFVGDSHSFSTLLAGTVIEPDDEARNYLLIRRGEEEGVRMDRAWIGWVRLTSGKTFRSAPYRVTYEPGIGNEVRARVATNGGRDVRPADATTAAEACPASSESAPVHPDLGGRSDTG